MRNPNGYGSVVKLSGNRRNPFCVRKTKGWNEKGHPIYDVIGYFPTREAGMIALAEYNRNPYDVDKATITLSELFQKWSERKNAEAVPVPAIQSEERIRSHDTASRDEIQGNQVIPHAGLH